MTLIQTGPMSGLLPDADAPALAVRHARPRWRDPRLIVGVLVVVLAGVLGARVVAAADTTVPVWAVQADLAAGTVLEADDLIVVRAGLGSTAALYADAAAPAPTGRLVRDVRAGELLPLAAVATGGERIDVRLVTVPVERARVPAGLVRGDRIDVLVTPRSDAGRAGPTLTLLEGAAVQRIDSGDRRLSAVGDTVGIAVLVPRAAVEQVVSGTRRGDIDLVRVPAATS